MSRSLCLNYSSFKASIKELGEFLLIITSGAQWVGVQWDRNIAIIQHRKKYAFLDFFSITLHKTRIGIHTIYTDEKTLII